MNLNQNMKSGRKPIISLSYSNTNTYLICGDKCNILFDTGWAGTFSDFRKEIKQYNVEIKDIDYILISHFHPDHMGIAQNIASEGPRIVVMDVQELFVHSAYHIFEKENKYPFVPINDHDIIKLPIAESRRFLKENGFDGEVIYTPGHSDDSISLILDDGNAFVGDLNPLYELELHKGTKIGDSWERILAKSPEKIYYGHAKTATLLGDNTQPTETKGPSDRYILTKTIMKYIDRGYHLDKIQKKTKADKTFIEDVSRMYLTHQNVGVQGILDRIEIKGR